MKRPIIYPYKMGSASARALANALGAPRVRPTDSYSPRENHLIINWGNSKWPNWLGVPVRFLNRCDRVAIASNKLRTFQSLAAHKIPAPEWTRDVDVAVEWLSDNTVVERHRLSGHSGEGIVLRRDKLAQAPLYVKYKKKRKEFRVHVCRARASNHLEVLDVQEKRRDRSYNGERNDYVRTHRTGWVYCRSQILEPTDLRPVSIAAVGALGLDFGAVDVIWNELDDKCYVLEVNTAPGLAGTTLDKYVAALKEWLDD